MPSFSSLGTPGPYHILSYGTLLGTEVFQSFIGGVVAFKVLARPAFATLQSGIFPVYFSMQTALPAVLALTMPGNAASRKPGLAGLLHPESRWNAFVPIVTVFAAGLANLTFIGPATTKCMKERKHQETRDGKKSYDPGPHSEAMKRLNKRFGVLHGISSSTNMIALIATVVYGMTLSDMIQWKES